MLKLKNKIHFKKITLLIYCIGMFFASSYNASQNCLKKAYTFCTKNTTRKIALGSYLAVCLIAKVVATIDNDRDLKFFDVNKTNEKFKTLFENHKTNKSFIVKLLRKFGQSGPWIKFGNIIPCYITKKPCDLRKEPTTDNTYKKITMQEKCLHHDIPTYHLGFLNILNYIFLILPTYSNGIIENKKS